MLFCFHSSSPPSEKMLGFIQPCTNCTLCFAFSVTSEGPKSLFLGGSQGALCSHIVPETSCSLQEGWRDLSCCFLSRHLTTVSSTEVSQRAGSFGKARGSTSHSPTLSHDWLRCGMSQKPDAHHYPLQFTLHKVTGRVVSRHCAVHSTTRASPKIRPSCAPYRALGENISFLLFLTIISHLNPTHGLMTVGLDDRSKP